MRLRISLILAAVIFVSVVGVIALAAPLSPQPKESIQATDIPYQAAATIFTPGEQLWAKSMPAEIAAMSRAQVEGRMAEIKVAIAWPNKLTEKELNDLLTEEFYLKGQLRKFETEKEQRARFFRENSVRGDGYDYIMAKLEKMQKNREPDDFALLQERLRHEHINLIDTFNIAEERSADTLAEVKTNFNELVVFTQKMDYYHNYYYLTLEQTDGIVALYQQAQEMLLSGKPFADMMAFLYASPYYQSLKK